uniref:Uncharacterized protein n=1 Tax=Neovison vison TaxID=452646 RepID=A0A8C7BSX7_NEOVI
MEKSTLSSLHRLLPNHLMEKLYSYKSEEDKQNCQNSEFSGLERILARHQFPKEINVTPKPSSMPLWKRKSINNSNRGWKKCYLWNKNLEVPPMSTIIYSSPLFIGLFLCHATHFVCVYNYVIYYSILEVQYLTCKCLIVLSSCCINLYYHVFISYL